MRRWPDQEAAIAHLEKVRWDGKPWCPYCGSFKVCAHASKDKNLPRWQCQDCRSAFSVTVGTIFHHTHLPLQTWFLALAIMLNAKKNVSNAQLGRDLGLPYKTAWSLALRIRNAMSTDPAQLKLFEGIVEMDETYIGGKPRKENEHKPDDKGDGGGNVEDNAEKPKSKRGRGTDKLPVVGIVERGGNATARSFRGESMGGEAMERFYLEKVDAPNSTVMTDEYAGYNKLKKHSEHKTVNHKERYVDGDTHTNTMEGVWALVKRSVYGQHHWYSDKFANLYIGETVYKYNNRNNGGVFSWLLQHMLGVAAC